MTSRSSATPPTTFGPDALAILPEVLGDARRVVVLCSASRRFVAQVVERLEGRAVEVFDGAQVHVPVEVVDAAEQVLARHDAQAIVSVGGGAATGLGKALRLRRTLRFVAIPTTYSASETTDIWGVREGTDKRTGRDGRVRPDHVLYDPTLTLGMPRALGVQSLLNALAHPVAVLAAAPDDGDALASASPAIADCVGAARRLVSFPRSLSARERALRGANAAGRCLDAGALGEHHRCAHVLGGRFGLPHAALHAILLRGFVHALRERTPAAHEAIARAADERDVPGLLHDLLRRVGAPTSLAELGVTWPRARAALEGAGLDAAIEWVHAVALGRRLSTTSRHVPGARGAPPLCVTGCAPEAAARVVVALHGRGADADSIARRVAEIVGDDPATAIVAPQADDRHWSAKRYTDPAAEHGEAFARAREILEAALAWIDASIPSVPVVLFGFSQGACFALELAAGSERRFAAVIALGGARLGPAADYAPASAALRDVPVLLGSSAGDPWLTLDDIHATARNLAAAGARPETIVVPGDAHEIAYLQRIRAREIVLGRDDRRGQPGFGHAHGSEARPDALPVRHNSPRHAPYGLFAEQLSGTGFTVPRADNRRTWLYRIRPSAGRPAARPRSHPTLRADFVGRPPEVNLVAHAPLPAPTVPTDFVDGLHTFGGAGDPTLRRGFAVHLYAANRGMEHRALCNADGELLLVPQHGRLSLLTEVGALDVRPGEIAIVPRGMLVSVLVHEHFARGYVAETFGPGFRLPERGPVGANALADPRHFRAPTAWPEDRLDPGFRITTKLGGRLHETRIDHSPYDVVAWHGSHVPYVYDLADFTPVATVLRDHVDPSVFTVVSAPLDELGTNALDLVVFPPRWDATEGTFRPPYFHRNVTTEINGIIRDRARGDLPWQPGMLFVTPSMTPHGVLAATADRELALDDRQADRPRRLANETLWFQLETALPIALTDWARAAPERIPDWDAVWGEHRPRWDPHRRDPF